MDHPHERLKYAREKFSEYSAIQAAEAMGVPEGTYYGHENGSRGFRRATADRYARFYKVRVAWLMFNQGGPRSANPLDDRVAALPPEDRRVILEQIEFMEARAALKRAAS